MGVIISAILLGISLCADCFAVSLCSSVSAGSLSRSRISGIAIVFAVVQSGLLVAGWGLADILYGLLQDKVGGVETVAHIISFLLLLYVGGSMVWESCKGEGESANLEGIRNIIIGAVATSIDAAAVGMSMSLAGDGWHEIWPIGLSVLICTYLSVVIGMLCGTALGCRFGKPVQILGGIILIGLGVTILLHP